MLRRGYNDHYLVTAPEHLFILRVYLTHKPYLRDSHDFQAEVNLLAILRAHGVPVSAPLVRLDGTLLGQIDTRYVAVSEYAEGREMSARDVSEAAAAHIGRTLTILHLTADELQLGGDRPRLDQTLLIDQPVAAPQRLLGRDADFLREYADGLKQRLATLPQRAGTFGYIHGDLHLGNLRVDEQQGCTLFDFDHSGFGWRAYELTDLRLLLGDAGWDAMLAGYQMVRPWTQSDMESLPLLLELRQLWDPGD